MMDAMRPTDPTILVRRDAATYVLKVVPGVIDSDLATVLRNDIEQATYILSADLYKRRDSVGGVLGISELGAIRMSPLGRDIAAIVRAYRREFFA
jgi:hypothetical protein